MPPSRSSPTIDVKRGVLYVGTGGSTTGVPQSLTNSVVALNLEDGKLRWVKQLEVGGGMTLSGFTSSPVLRTLGSGNRNHSGRTALGHVYGLDPDHGGEILWKTPVGAPANGAANASAINGGIAWGLAADYHNLYVATSGLLAQPGNAAGSLTALDLKTGIVRWNTPAPTSGLFLERGIAGTPNHRRSR